MGLLTDRTVKAVKVLKQSSLYLADGGSLYLRVLKSGTKSWVYRFGGGKGKGRWLNIGTYPSMPLVDARKQAAELKSKRRHGIDPIEEKRLADARIAAEKALAAARITVEALFERWFELELSKRKDKGAEARRSFTKDVLPTIGALPAGDVTRAIVANIIDAVVSRGARVGANHLLGNLRQMYGFAIARGLVENDPTSHLKKADFGGRKIERERVLSEDEIRELHRKLPASNLQEKTRISIWIMLSTCCRVGEFTRASWDQIDFATGEWRIPAENSKNSRAHTIYLSKFSVAQFESLKEITGNSQSYARKLCMR